MEAEFSIDRTREMDFIYFKRTSHNKFTILLHKMQCSYLHSITLHFVTKVIINIVIVVTLY